MLYHDEFNGILILLLVAFWHEIEDFKNRYVLWSVKSIRGYNSAAVAKGGLQLENSFSEHKITSYKSFQAFPRCDPDFRENFWSIYGGMTQLLYQVTA